jgi:ribonuclease E
MEKMLINAIQSEEIRVALVKDNFLYDLDIECPNEEKKRGNIYKATITRREPSLNAVFVEYGAKRQGFLSLKDIASEYLSHAKPSNPEGDEKSPIATQIREGQELLIQVDKEERGNKGAALTTYITLAGCYLVLMPNNPNSGGVSRRIEGEERDELKTTLNQLRLPDGMGLIIRTAGVGKNLDELQTDLDMLLNQWEAIKKAYKNCLAPCLIHQESDVVIRSIRDNLRKSTNEIIIDDQIAFIKAKQYIEQVKPDFLKNLKLYNSTIPLYNYYQIESQIETAYQREVRLPSGGSLVIDRTEALVSIDINSAKATGGTDIETTAFNTNLEAADEIARQLRLRDLGGLIVIDFIDMNNAKNQRDVESRLKEALENDRARIQVGRISRFGLLEMSRQRLRLSLGESSQDICPRCEGRGTVRNIQSHSLAIVRLIEEEALKKKIAQIQVQLPVEMATYIINEKRNQLANIEKRHGVDVVVVANPHLQMPHYSINSVKLDNITKAKRPSYELIEEPQVMFIKADDERLISSKPAVEAFAQSSHSENGTKDSVLKKIWQIIFGSKATKHMSKGTVKEDESNKPSHQQRRRPNAQQRSKQRQRQDQRHAQSDSSSSQRSNQQRRRRPAGGGRQTQGKKPANRTIEN